MCATPGSDSHRKGWGEKGKMLKVQRGRLLDVFRTSEERKEPAAATMSMAPRKGLLLLGSTSKEGCCVTGASVSRGCGETGAWTPKTSWRRKPTCAAWGDVLIADEMLGRLSKRTGQIPTPALRSPSSAPCRQKSAGNHLAGETPQSSTSNALEQNIEGQIRS